MYHKWDVKNDFVYVLQFFSLISDSLGSVTRISQIFLEQWVEILSKGYFWVASLHFNEVCKY